jgi:hypothetical protein
VDSATHTARFSDFALVHDAMTLLARHGYRELHSSLERLVPKSFRLVGGKAHEEETRPAASPLRGVFYRLSVPVRFQMPSLVT